MPYNLESPNTLLEPIDPSNIERWFVRETIQIESEAVRHVLHHVAGHLVDFVEWPKRAVLLWDGCDRCKPDGKPQKYHTYPKSIRTLAKAKKITLNSRPNGPARAAFTFAGGTRPERFGSTNATTMHHVYSGKFPYIDRVKTTHAVKLVKHFTQSAGVIATHPVADALCDEYPFFAGCCDTKRSVDLATIQTVSSLHGRTHLALLTVMNAKSCFAFQKTRTHKGWFRSGLARIGPLIHCMIYCMITARSGF
jgi:hypothetical protein